MEMNLKNHAKILCMVVTVMMCLVICSENSFGAVKKLSKVESVKVSSTYNSCSVSWGKTKNAKSYKVYRAVKNTKTGKYGKYKHIKTTKSRSYKCSGTSGRTYSFKIRAINRSKSGSYSSAKAITCKPETTTMYTPKSSPEGIKLTWKNIRGESGYKIYRSTATGSFKHIKTVSGTSYTDSSGLTRDKTYRYKVRAYVKAGKSDVYGSYSNIVKGTKTKATTNEYSKGYLDYSKSGSKTETTRLYIGQTWSNELNAKLNGGTAVNKLLSREHPGYSEGCDILWWHNGEYKDLGY